MKEDRPSCLPPHISYLYLNETDSTNTYLKQWAKDDEQPYVVAWTGHQTAGRGQRGNSWEAEAGKNLLCTFMHYPAFIKPEEQFFLSQLIALNLIEVLQALCPDEQEHFRIKWPNDIYWKDRKLAGILIEYELNAQGIQRALIGIGLNVNQKVFRSDAPNPVSLLQITGREYDVKEILVTLSQTYFGHIHQAAQETDFSLCRTATDQAYHALLFRLNTPARYRDANGEFTGIIQGTAPDGCLLVNDEQGHQRTYAFKEIAYIIR